MGLFDKKKSKKKKEETLTLEEDWGIAAELEDEPIMDALAAAEQEEAAAMAPKSGGRKDAVPTAPEVEKMRDRDNLRAKRK